MKAKRRTLPHRLTLVIAVCAALTACGGSASELSKNGVSDTSNVGSDLRSAAKSSRQSDSLNESSSVSRRVSQNNIQSGSQSGSQSDSQSDSQSEEPPISQPIETGGEIIGAELRTDSGRCILLHTMDDKNGASYANSVNFYKEKFPDVNMYSLVIPSAISFYLPETFKHYDPGEREHIDRINARLKNVAPVDVYSVLERRTDEPIYFLTDHHWTQLGAFYAAEEFAKTAGVDFEPLSEFEEKDGGLFVGSAYGNSGNDPRIEENPEKFIYYVPKSDFTTKFYELDGSGGLDFYYFADPSEFDNFGKYSLYMYGDSHIVRLNTSCKNGRRLLVLKEAFANPFCCNLVNSFEEIWIADIKYMKTTATRLIRDNGITDLLFALSTFSTSGENQAFLKQIM